MTLNAQASSQDEDGLYVAMPGAEDDFATAATELEGEYLDVVANPTIAIGHDYADVQAEEEDSTCFGFGGDGFE